MNALVVGLGSIGCRHTKELSGLGLNVASVSHHTEGPKNYHTLPEAIECHRPEYVVIANETSRHGKTLKELLSLDYGGKILVEKPLVEKLIERDSGDFQKRTWVGYNLRCLSGFELLRSLIQGERVFSVHCYVGKHIGTWRPDRPVESSSSARKESGGGVLRDLSHELDYLTWLFGSWKSVFAQVDQRSDLPIQTEDSCSLMLTTVRNIAINLEMNYLDRIGQRFLTVITHEKTIRWDLIENRLQVGNELIRLGDSIAQTYRKLHENILENKVANLCTYSQGIETVELIEAIESSHEQKQLRRRA